MTRLIEVVPNSRTLILVGLLLLQTLLVNAVSLSDFTPEAYNLTASCEAVYTAQIAGCNAIDFQSPTATQATCSSSCIQALVNTNSQVYDACSTDPQNNVQLIGAFLSGAGIQDLCPNVVVTTLVAGNFVSTTTASTTSSGKITATVTADGDGNVVGASTTTTMASATSLSGTTMGSQVMQGTSVLVIPATPSSVSGSLSDGIIVDTRTPAAPLSTNHATTTLAVTAASSISSSHIVTIMPSSTAGTSSSLDIVTSTSTNIVSSTSPASSSAVVSTACASAEHGGSPFDYCNTNSASSVDLTDWSAVVMLVGMAALWLLG